tara:strand:+ start:811 stop:1545 length:735 start_codon:yes stop_codon:yes gene_type:complete
MADSMDFNYLKCVVDAALLAAGEPLSIDRLAKLFVAEERDYSETRKEIKNALERLEQECEGRGFVLRKVATGYRYQIRQDLSPWVSRLWDERPPRYSRALLETLALIIYKQPATRGDIEQIRGVSVSPNIMRTLLERGWIKVVGQREVPGRPSMYGTTKSFLDYFDLKSINELPPLPEIKQLLEPLALDEGYGTDAENNRSEENLGILSSKEVPDEELSSSVSRSGLAEVVPLPILGSEEIDSD